MRILAGLALALLLVITTTSAYLRLAQTGLSCPGAPDCYARSETRAAADDDPNLTTARALHRIAASAAGAVILAILFVGWSAARPNERAAAIALAVLAAMLAWLGRYTPSGLPAVTLGNLLGGMAMLALAGWLALALGRAPRIDAARAVRPWAFGALALVALQIAAGGLIAARHAAFACTSFPDCGGTLWPPGAD
ncbi:MAG: COX15/CtaA family protein, partial [Burkholderiales bacterium]